MKPETQDAIHRLAWRAMAALKFSRWLEATQLLSDDEKRESAESFFVGGDEFIFPPDERTRLERRDDAIREALAKHYSGMTQSGAAKSLSFDLGRVASRTPPICKAARQSLVNIVELNHGRALAWRQILNVRDGFRCG